MTSARKKVVFFSPHAGIWPHALPESFLAKSLEPQSFDVCRIKCDGTFNRHCTVMSAAAVSIGEKQDRKDAICRQCINNAAVLCGSYAGKDYLISDYLNKEDMDQADDIVAGLKENEIQELTFRGIEVGRIASYELLLRFKKTSLDFGDEEYVYFETYVRNALLSLIAFSKIFDEIQPDILVTYSPQYAVLGMCARYCELQGKLAYFVEGSSNIDERYKALRVWNWTEFGLTNPALRYWDNADSYNLSKEDFVRIERHVKRLLDASSFSVYSAPATGQFNMRTHFGIASDAKVVMAAMSSYDEVYSAYAIRRFPDNKYISSVFKNQLEWIKYTIEFISTQPELFLIVRIHPRTFPTKRNSVMAQEQFDLSEILATLPKNVKVNYPTDNISIYDLYKQIDALATGWSATGVEAMTFNVPVITYDCNLPSYPASIHYTGDSKAKYYENLLKAVNAGKSKAVSERARRWMAFSMSVGVVKHPAMLNDMNFIKSSIFAKFFYRAFNRLFPGIIKRIEASQQMRLAEANRFNELLKTGGRSLYDIQRIQE